MTGPTPDPGPSRVIEVFADVACPFTHVGLRRLVARRERLGRADVVLRIRAWPLELVNGAPLRPAAVDEEVEELRRVAAPDLFTGFDVGRFPASSLPALALAAAASSSGDPSSGDPSSGDPSGSDPWGSDGRGEAVGLALRHALFEDGLDIADPGVLADVAATHGVEAPGPGHHQRVRSDWEEGRRRGVVGSPHFFVDGDDFFCPSLDVARVDGRLRVTPDQAAFEAFLAVCFT